MQGELLMPQECCTSLGQEKMAPGALRDSTARPPRPCCHTAPGSRDPKRGHALLRAHVTQTDIISEGKLVVSVLAVRFPPKAPGGL